MVASKVDDLTPKEFREALEDCCRNNPLCPGSRKCNVQKGCVFILLHNCRNIRGSIHSDGLVCSSCRNKISEWRLCIYFPMVLSRVWLLCDPMDWSPPGSSIHGILQARTLEWVAIFSFRGSSSPRNQTHVSCIARRFFTSEPPGKPKIPSTAPGNQNLLSQICSLYKSV